MSLYADSEPGREEVATWRGVTLLEFGAPWCGYCLAAQPIIAAALRDVPLRHLQIEDGKGRPLGRAFRVKLWPTLIVLKDGQEVARVIRPVDTTEVAEALASATH